MSYKAEVWKVRLTICSPVHIGSGHEYDPTEFLIKNGKMHFFDPLEFVETLSDPQNFKTACQQVSKNGDPRFVFRFIRDHAAGDIVRRTVTVPKELEKKYHDVLQEGSKADFNAFAIKAAVLNPRTGQPYIPGSSIKGALRTAWLELLAEKEGFDKGKCLRKNEKNRKFLDEERLLGGSFAADPFRFVKVSDFLPVGEVETRVVYAINVKRPPKNGEGQDGADKQVRRFGRGPTVALEVIPPGSEFRGTITVWPPTAKIKKPVRLKTLKGTLRKFFLGKEKRYVHERQILKQLGVSRLEKIEMKIKLENQEESVLFHLIRLGHHSGAEAVTIENFRDIQIRGPGGKSRSAAEPTTIWLASEEEKPKELRNCKPFGWCMLEADEQPEKNAEVRPAGKNGMGKTK